ncbi:MULTISPECIES: TetR/AcrR family transcriptional regulator [unclassified Pseudonocardia]|uniref:TetR/AcrR family transcriptional regulator n=1 Tax=unclassified Pseudonocardia TaxID=2619320 RepID=UPI0001FFEAD9|nr:TetR/AcrR family transcriptional regulator [Pseudonocardia sp. Ae707_Ps1]OLM20479.1 Transcriptional regulator, TetR family [Pseudonocardia sp. Ae707_Ps1]
MPRADAARNRDRALDTGRLLLASGDDTLALNDVAKQAGLGVATVYRHFPTRRALLEALMDGRLDELVAEAEAAAGEPDAATGLARLARAVLVRQLGVTGFAEVFATTDDEREETSGRKARVLLLADRVLARAVREGATPAGTTAMDVQRLLCGVAYAARLDPVDPSARAEDYLDLLLAGLRTRAATV